MGASCYSPVGRALRIYQRMFRYRTVKVGSPYGLGDAHKCVEELACTVFTQLSMPKGRSF